MFKMNISKISSFIVIITRYSTLSNIKNKYLKYYVFNSTNFYWFYYLDNRECFSHHFPCTPLGKSQKSSSLNGQASKRGGGGGP